MEKIRILIVEDNNLVQELYDHGLSSDIFDKRFVNNGRDALDVYTSWQPDIILLDYMVPIMSGFTLLKKIRKDIGDSSTVIIMSTFVYNKDDLKSCFDLGLQGYITKPFRYSEIGELVLEYYRKANPERE